MQQYTYLALGDSYTIGEGVPLAASFPYQLVQLLRMEGLSFTAPEIVAQTGWTTGELLAEADRRILLQHYDLVTLLIGVNNQYRGLSPDEYAAEFELLLRRAMALSKRVVVLSIPDWSVTPFAADRDCEKIAAAIDGFNAVNSHLAAVCGVKYIDITTVQRLHGGDAGFLAADLLHPAKEEYALWANQLLSTFGGIGG